MTFTRKTFLAALAAIALSTPAQQPARAELCTVDVVPAATLLLPYFEIDLNKFPRFRKVEQTIISLQNVGAAPAIAHVALWTDLSVATLSFDVFLTGYDVQEINLTELFHTGEIRGVTGQQLPDFVLGETPSGGLQNLPDLIRAHRGQAINGECYGRPSNGNKAVGYVTIDNVDQFSILFPYDEGYFGQPGIANDQNALWGLELLKSKKAFQAAPLVHIEAGDFGAGEHTFYGRYVGYNGSDNREPLGTTWAVRYFAGQEATDLIVWRDSTVDQGAFPCGQLGGSGWYPLEQTEILVWDESEAVIEPFFDPDDSGAMGSALPAETQKVRMVSDDFDVGDFQAGWARLDLRDPRAGRTQSFVQVRQAFRKRRAIYPGLAHYDINAEVPADASACGPAPAGLSTIR